MHIIKLVEPTIEYKHEIEAFREEMLEDGSDFAGCAGLKICKNCESWLDELAMLADAKTCPNGFAPSSSFLAVRADGRVVGIIELRHHIKTSVLKTWGGHIGFSVRPSERRRGYAKEMLRDLLSVSRERGMISVLVTCDSENIASARTITANGGVFEKEITVDGKQIKRYWITL